MSGLALVTLTSEAFLVCLTHSFTTEQEEVMGLLLGDIIVNFLIFSFFLLF